MRAARALVRAHPAMAVLWRLCDASLDGRAQAFADTLAANATAAADSIRWVVGRRRIVVLTHSASSSVREALGRIESRIALVICSASLPGGEGRAFARTLERAGLRCELIPDAAIARSCGNADLAIVGADAVTGSSVVNKVGTAVVALAARASGIPCYALASTEKFIPSGYVRADGAFEATDLALFDAVLTERGPLRPAAVRRAVARVQIAPQLAKLAP